MNDDTETFTEYRRLLLHQLDELTRDVSDLDSKIDTLHDDILTLKVKAASWGALAGLIPTIIGIAFKVFS